MSTLAKQSTFIPCEPFTAKIYDIMVDQIKTVRVIGYRVAIREIAQFQTPSLLSPIGLHEGTKHGIIAVPEWERLEVVELTKFQASPL